jgi:hypothetical protein
MVQSATSMGISVLLTTLALASSSDPYGSTYAMPSIATLTSAILGPPFVTPSSLTAHDSQSLYTSESLTAPAPSTNTAATQTLDPMTATNTTSSVSAVYTGHGTPTATSSSGDWDQTVTCVDRVKVRALRPTPVSDSGSIPLKGQLRGTWWAGWGTLSMSTCMLAML